MVTAEVWTRRKESGVPDGEVDLDRDRRLVERAQAGDRDAFDTLYACYFGRLERYCLQRLRDPYEAQDIAQEAFLRAWRALPNFAGDRRFYPWLSVIASNLCTDSLRRKQRFGPVPVPEPREREVAQGSSAEEAVVAAVDLDIAARALSNLTDRHRRVLDLRERSGLSYQAIADQEGIRVTTVETLIWRARQAFKREFCALAESEGTLAGVGVLALEGGRLRRIFRFIHSSPARLASFGAPGIAASVGGAVATIAIVVAAASPAPHVQGSASAGDAPPAVASSDVGSYGRPAGPSSPSTSARTSASGNAPAGSRNGAASGSSTSTGGVNVSNLASGARTSVEQASGRVGTGVGQAVKQTAKGPAKTVSGLARSATGTLGGVSGTATQLLSGVDNRIDAATEKLLGLTTSELESLEKATEGLTKRVGDTTKAAEQDLSEAKSALESATEQATKSAAAVLDELGGGITGGSTKVSSSAGSLAKDASTTATTATSATSASSAPGSLGKLGG